MNIRETLLRRGRAVIVPGIYDSLSALLAEQAGFEALYLSGASVSYTQLGRPDVGLLSLDRIADCAARVRERVALPLIVDADTGFGDVLNVRRTVQVLERTGANAIQLEDQSFPKRCGHLAGQSLVTQDEMAGKVRAAVDARSSRDFAVIARTDAIAAEGLSSALERAEAYIEAGADAIFVEAPRNDDEIITIARKLAGRVPLVANMVEGGRTPLWGRDELEEFGFNIVLVPGAIVRAFVRMADELLATLRMQGSTKAFSGRMLDLKSLNARLGLEELQTVADRYVSSPQGGAIAKRRAQERGS